MNIKIGIKTPVMLAVYHKPRYHESIFSLYRGAFQTIRPVVSRKKTLFFRSIRAGRHCAAASRFAFLKGKTLQRRHCVSFLEHSGMICAGTCLGCLNSFPSCFPRSCLREEDLFRIRESGSKSKATASSKESMSASLCKGR